MTSALYEHPILVRRTKINVHAGDALAAESQEFGVAKRFAVGGGAAVGHERLVAFDKDALDILVAAGVAVGPATLKPGRLVDGVVVGAGEGEVVREQGLDDFAILVLVGAEMGPHDAGQFGVLHRRLYPLAASDSANPAD